MYIFPEYYLNDLVKSDFHHENSSAVVGCASKKSLRAAKFRPPPWKVVWIYFLISKRRIVHSLGFFQKHYSRMRHTCFVFLKKAFICNLRVYSLLMKMINVMKIANSKKCFPVDSGNYQNKVPAFQAIRASFTPSWGRCFRSKRLTNGSSQSKVFCYVHSFR